MLLSLVNIQGQFIQERGFVCRLNPYINPLTAKLFNSNFHPLEVVDRVSETQLQVGEKHSDLTEWRSNIAD